MTETAAEVTGFLRRALAGSFAGLKDIDGRFQLVPVEIIPRATTRDHRSIRYRIRQLLKEATPWSHGPGFNDLRHWVRNHLVEPAAVRPPEGTVELHLGGTNFRPTRVPNNVAATRKLILAAAFYGADEIGRLVTAFLGHGLIETRQSCLLKGWPIESEIVLDDYCSLVPYRDMMDDLKQDDDVPGLLDKWPPADSPVCVLETTQFEDKFVGPPEEVGTTYGSPLVKYGVDHLSLLLSVVWGYGFSCFVSKSQILPAVNAALPFDGLGGGLGGMVRRTELLVTDFGRSDRMRPLPVSELSRLAVAYSCRGEATQRTLRLAMRWFRESLTRIHSEDTVISLGVAMEALFGEQGEHRGFRRRLSSRGSWYYADSAREKQDTESLIGEFYDLRSRIVHGGQMPHPPPMLAEEVSRVLRSSIKSMIANGRPSDWGGGAGDGSIRRDPPRSDEGIPSDKADSLSWSVRERTEIDRQLRRAWESTLAGLPSRPPDIGGPSVHHGPIHSEELSLRQEGGIPFVIGDPATLYMAHPKWPKQPSDELDERTLYYCSRDVDRHLKSWEQAALERSSDYIWMENDAELYHPQHRNRWPQPLAAE
ncbi:MAG: HEPN domain-containing protein [bacterium]|nr:HEPN domain-containing protein [bacterium]